MDSQKYTHSEAVWAFKEVEQGHLVSLLYLLIAGWCCAAQFASASQGRRGLPACLSHLSVQQLWDPS